MNEKQAKLDELMAKYHHIKEQIDKIADELDSQDAREDEILADADMICEIYIKFRVAGMPTESAYELTRAMLEI